MLKKNKILVMFILCTKILTDNKISFFMDRSYTPDREDFLTLFIATENTKKIVYKLPHTLYNKEVFKLKICKKGTSEEIKKKEELFNEKKKK